MSKKRNQLEVKENTSNLYKQNVKVKKSLQKYIMISSG